MADDSGSAMRLFADAPALLKAGRYVDLIAELRRVWDTVDEPALSDAVRDELVPCVAESSVDEWLTVAGADTFGDSLFNLSVLFWTPEGYQAAAVQAARLAIEHGSEDAPVALAQFLLWLGDTVEATDILRRTIDDHAPGLERAQFLLGRHFAEEFGRVDEETRDLLVSALPTEPDARVPLAKVERGRGDLVAAVQLLSAAADTGDPTAAIRLGNLYADDLDDPAAAELAYRRGIELGDPFSAYNLGLLLEGSGRENESIPLYRWAAAGGDASAVTRLEQLGA